jgi:hypothetical protein
VLAGEKAPAKLRTWRHRVSPASSPVPVQRAPRRPLVDSGRAVSGAARERSYEPRPRAPRLPRQSAVTGDVPVGQAGEDVAGSGTICQWEGDY